MPFFHRPRRTDMACTPTPHAPREAQDSLCNTERSLKAAFQRHLQVVSAAPTASKSAVHSAVLCTIGLAALAGVALYASRKPRIPEGVHPVENFDLNRYLGKWYELARIDNRFEKGLQRTQAEYSVAPNGSMQVVNRGYHPRRGEWKTSHGTAKPTLAPDIAALKVSFFGPFYGGYNVVALDEHYRWAMVIGSSLDYVWILSRQPSLPESVKERLMHQARMLGVDTQKILWVHQDGVNPTGSYK